MKLLCYALKEYSPKLVAASPHRFWMDQFPARHAYRCLPLNIANSHGWELLCPVPVEIEWNGGPLQQDLTVRALKPLPGNLDIDVLAHSNFARGIITFRLEYLFQTEPGWDLMCTGPLNHFKENAQGLSGIIETDWLPYPFTMNWQILRPGKVVFDEDEPICFLFPIKKQALLDCQPEIRRLSDDPELEERFLTYRKSRDEFMKRYLAGDQAAVKQGWQRHYFTGVMPDGSTAPKDHINKLRLKEPIDLRKPLISASIGIEPPPKFLLDGSVQDRATAPRSDPRWAHDSPLNAIQGEPTDRNEAGRKRFGQDGRLVSRENLKVAAFQAEAADLDIVVIDDFLGSAECDALCRAFARLEPKTEKYEQNPFWSDRCLPYATVDEAMPEAARIMAEAQKRGAQLASLFYRLKAPVYPELAQMVRWPAGTFMPPHALNRFPDGRPDGASWRSLAAVCYLNDEFTGGEMLFTARDVAIKPKRGMFVAWAGGFQDERGIARIETGAQLTLSFFLTFDQAKADRPRSRATTG